MLITSIVTDFSLTFQKSHQDRKIDARQIRNFKHCSNTEVRFYLISIIVFFRFSSNNTTYDERFERYQ